MLCWNVYRGNFNKREIDTFNIFNHCSFYDDCVKAKKKHKDDKDGFASEVRSNLMYYFWSKCEWEIVLEQWPSGEMYRLRKSMKLGDLRSVGIECQGGDDQRKVSVRVYPEDNTRHGRKIDVYEQVMNNWDIFIDYLWDHRKELKARKQA